MWTWKRSCPWALFLGLAAGAATAQDASVEAEEGARLAALAAVRAEAILAREEGRGRPFDPAFRAAMKARLAEASTEELDAVDKRGYGLLSAPKALGDGSADLVYTPIAPCRIIDTRLAGGALLSGATRDFYVAGTVGFAGQGGNPTGCGLPIGPATAAVVNFVAVNPAGPGNLRAWAYGGAVPNASIINYATVGMNIANAVVVPLCEFATTNCTPADLTVQADVSGTHLVADVVGYFRNVVKAQYRSFAVSATRTNLLLTLPATGCTNTGAGQITVVAPVAGRIEVQGRAIYNISHVSGTGDQISTYIGTTDTDCSSSWGLADLTYVHLTRATEIVNTTAHATRVFDVAPGTYTYFLNVRQHTGGGTDRIDHIALVATFHPD
jgi:hypothetical protein